MKGVLNTDQAAHILTRHANRNRWHIIINGPAVVIRWKQADYLCKIERRTVGAAIRAAALHSAKLATQPAETSTP